MLRWTHDTIRGNLCPAHGSTRLVGAQWIVERRAAACRLRADLAPQSIPRRRGRVDRVRVSSRGPQPPARFTGGVLKSDKLSLQGISESPDGVTVSLADQPGVEVLAVQVDVAKQPAIAVPGIAGGVRFERHRLALKRRLGVGAGLRSKMLHGLGRVYRLPGCPRR